MVPYLLGAARAEQSHVSATCRLCCLSHHDLCQCWTRCHHALCQYRTLCQSAMPVRNRRHDTACWHTGQSHSTRVGRQQCLPTSPASPGR
eukprot:1693046-Rhodomonas_salina.2